MTGRQYHFIIIGGGVAGPVAALRLSQDGHRCTIYERSAKLTTIGGSVNLAPNGMHCLNRLGVGDELRRRGCAVPYFAVKDENGAILSETPNMSRDGVEGIRIMRATLQEVLLAEGKRQGLKIVYGKNLEAIEESEDGVTAHFGDGTDAKGDYLIGADGIHSKTRDFVDMGKKPEYTGTALVYGIMPTKVLPNVDFASMPPFCGIFARDGFFATAFSNQSRESVYWFTYKRKEIAEKTMDAERLRNEEYTRYKHLCYPFPDIISSTDEFFSWPVYVVPPLTSWHKGRVVLVGDAAHASPPKFGQGVSHAIDDVFILARVVSHGEDLAKYDALRRPHIDKLRASQKNDQREYERGPWVQWLLTWRNWAVTKMVSVIAWATGWDRFGYDPDKVKL